MERKTEHFSALLNREGSASLFQTARRVCQLVHEAGGRALFVGGCVRDLLLGKTVKDIDIECYHIAPQQLLRVLEPHFPLDPVGMSFGILKLRHREIDVALPRRENKRGLGHRGFLVDLDPSLSIAEAAARRDFTVNAMLWDPLTEEFLDPWQGKKDLAAKCLRHISEHFSEDPLRVLRAMQFAARFGFSVAPETMALCRTISREGLAQERMAGEWDKLLLQGRFPSCGLRFLNDCGWAAFFPGVAEALQTPELHALMDAAVACRKGDGNTQRLFMLAVFTSFFPDEISIGKFIRSVWLQKDLLPRLLPLYRSRAALFSALSDRALRHLAVDVQSPALLLALGQVLAGDPPCGAFSANRRRMVELGISECAPVPLIRGRDLAALGVPPGKKMGELLTSLFEAQLNGEFQTAAEGLARLPIPEID